MRNIQRYRIRTLAFITMLIAITGCSKTPGNVDVNAHRDEIEKWKEHRLTRLKSDTGWLTLCGLFWLKEGENRFGTDSTNAIIFPPGKAPMVSGSIWLEKGSLRMEVQKSVEVTVKDSVATSIPILSDGEGLTDPTIMSLGTLSFFVIKRSGQLAVRVKDKENPARVNFRGLDYFSIDPKWRIEAKFEPYTPPKKIPIASVIGTVENDSCPGALVFDVDGKACRLDAVMEVGTDDQLFIMFSDETSGKETYGPGRQLYTGLPDSTGKVILDFNKAYNWPCVFTEYATCPIPPPQNHLPIRVEAGEKMYHGDGH